MQRLFAALSSASSWWMCNWMCNLRSTKCENSWLHKQQESCDSRLDCWMGYMIDERRDGLFSKRERNEEEEENTFLLFFFLCLGFLVSLGVLLCLSFLLALGILARFASTSSPSVESGLLLFNDFSLCFSSFTLFSRFFASLSTDNVLSAMRLLLRTFGNLN